MNNQSKVILDLAVSLDGYIEGPNGEVDWCIMDPEMNFNTFLKQISAIIYGRKSYDLWGNYKPQLGNAENGDDTMWQEIHSKQKYVFTHQKSLVSANAEYIHSEDMVVILDKIKAQQTKDIWLYGGSSIITSFINNNLIDEYRLSIHPVVLGSGKPLFEHLTDRVNLIHVETNTYQSGVVQLIYNKNKSL
ncbi:dihydrofolate reductase family protein [Staphylococcus xylosus]|uniref:dihydrofolate reductase family protein n=1 Tax=Staphylococcus xylosus TaxID=1288 RepID=UPI0018ED95C3|nr:dihydrofolate reductase family protein [Staphylococcus xylosus]MEB7755875.1 dihydrofolate reductase family protein [Staphylococcus xylosus]MEB7797663.1 dihydrofolate reductase family protein [Staphylococcus xylosus]MEB8146932.1 dihydrofolate reductase family protein [Staphylococcus xylosus]MEB8306207.1 dihydrofolate reductase family protein [Staphylococcus xylosus]